VRGDWRGLGWPQDHEGFVGHEGRRGCSGAAWWGIVISMAGIVIITIIIVAVVVAVSHLMWRGPTQGYLFATTLVHLLSPLSCSVRNRRSSQHTSNAHGVWK
jgi:hypothetical protein